MASRARAVRPERDFHYLGPALAVLLFTRVEVLGVAWLRITSAAVVFAAWRRPWRQVRRLARRQRRLVLYLGVVLALMNVSFYLAVARCRWRPWAPSSSSAWWY